MSATGKIGLTYNVCMLMMDNKRWSNLSEVSLVSYGASSQGCVGSQVWYSPVPKAGRVDIPNILIQRLIGGRTLGSDPGVPHGALGIVIGILQLGKIKADPLWGSFFPVVALQPIQVHRDCVRLVTPVAFWAD